MQTLYNGVEVFTNSDDYDLANDVANAFKSANLVIPVPSKNVRDAIPDPYGGMTVARLDLPGCPLETYDGTKWPVSDVPWTNIGMAQGFNPVTDSGWSGLKYAVRNGWVIVDGAVQRDTAWAAGITCAVVPASIAPAVKIQGSNNAYVEGINISLGSGSVAVSFSITWPLF